MIGARRLERAAATPAGERLGTGGHLAILGWSLAMVMLVPAERIHLAAVACLGTAALAYPLSLHRLLRPRWLLLLGLLALPPMFLLGEGGGAAFSIGLSAAGVVAGLQIAVRFVVVVVAVDGFTAAVDVAAMAGLLERVGLKGLGFSMGVALNLLPALQRSAANAWHSLWMRGGLRRHRLRAVRLLLVTVVSNALRHGEEIALAAEARAFSPDCARPLPVKAGRLDWAVAALAPICLLAFCAVRF
ncbi:MAG TPA: CbiQ family ECF transporter T component [Anaerolineae bacterium]|nr:CbiQ family ECF transporter T component [Anaerolineae bacterium]